MSPLFLLFKFLYQLNEQISVEDYLKLFTKSIRNYLRIKIKFSIDCPENLKILYVTDTYSLFKFLIKQLEQVEDTNKLQLFNFVLTTKNTYLEISKVKLDFNIKCNSQNLISSKIILLATEDYIKTV